uniref:Uncharacterized protein n=1 Tax=Ditylenchus dipsaci TaxID=166011 RepID=A0A915CM46_9BILA
MCQEQHSQPNGSKQLQVGGTSRLSKKIREPRLLTRQVSSIFTGNHTRKLLTGDGPQKITDVIFDYPSCHRIVSLPLVLSAFE